MEYVIVGLGSKNQGRRFISRVVTPLENRFILPVRRRIRYNKKYINVVSYCRAMYDELFSANCEGIGALYREIQQPKRMRFFEAFT